ncbi:MAG: LPS export ABC transporter periplasmic protein LptC [Nitrospiria bacterium]
MTFQGSKAFILIWVVVSLFVLAFLLTKHVKNQENSPMAVRPVTRADIGMKDLAFVQTRNGQIEWEIRAKSAQMFGQEHQVAITDAHIMLKTPQGWDIRFEGDEGTINTVSYDFKIENQREDIKVELSNGYTILTRVLEWQNQQREIRSDEPIKVLNPRFMIEGVGLLLNTLNQEFAILRDVHVTLQK